MKFFSRRLVMAEHLNGANRLFGGRLLSWIDEEAYIYVRCQLKHANMVTRYMSEVNFISAGQLGDIIELGIELVRVGRTSVTVACRVRNKDSAKPILEIDEIVFVAVDDQGKPTAHGCSMEGLAQQAFNE